MDTKSLLDHVAERNTGLVGADIASAMDKYCPQYEINTPLRLAHFIAQACHETGAFRYLVEIWGPTPAQKGYEGRRDLGNYRAGDGFLYRGRGIFDLTGRANYSRIGAALGLPLETEPKLAADPVIATRIACLYWKAHSINGPADADNIQLVTRLVNGGQNGLADREACLLRVKEVLS